MTPITDRAAGYVVHVVGPTDYQAVPIETARELESMCEELARCLEALCSNHHPTMYIRAEDALAHYQQLKEKAK